jgi:hypothetical protein
MTNNLTDKLTPYEEFLIEAAEDNTNRYSGKSVQLIIKNGIGDYFYTVSVPEKLKKSELAKMIGAERLKKYNIRSKHVEKLDNLSRDSDKLVNREEYLVITNNTPNTKKLIQNCKDKNETFTHANNTNHTLDLMDSYKDEN